MSGRNEFRFYRYSGKRRRVPGKIVGLATSLLTLSLILTLACFGNTPATANYKADPAVWNCIVNGKGSMVTIAYRGKLPVKVKVFKRWTFGNLKIIYAYATAQALKKLVKAENVIRICAWEKIGLPPTRYIVKREGYVYDFSKDMKRIYHKANQRWTGKGITIAIIDTGIDYLHPDFYRNGVTVIKALVSTIYEINGSPIVINTTGFTRQQMLQVLKYELYIKNETHGTSYVFEDAVGHGTHVAGIIVGQGTASGGRYMGIAPDANLVVIKAFYDTNGGWADEVTILDALQWIYNNSNKYHIKILSCSWGCAPSSPLPNTIELAMEQLVKDKHIFIFCAAGNEGAIPSTILSPARDPYVFAVGAIDPYTNQLPPWTSLGEPVIPPIAPPKDVKPDFVGAGVDIIAPASEFANFPSDAIIHGNGGNYVIMSGTSMATPAVAACFADFYQYYLQKYGRPPTRQAFINYVRNYGIVYDPLTKDFLTGWGAPTVPPPS